MRIIHSGWRGTALGITVVMLGAVLSVPGATAAPPATIEISPVCAGSTVTLTVTGRELGDYRGYLYIKSERANGDTEYESVSNDGGTVTGTLDLLLGGAPGAWISIVGYSRGPNEDVFATTWYSVGCARLVAAPRQLAEQPGPQQLGVAVSGFQGRVPVELTLPGSRPVSVMPNADGVFQGTVTFERQPACGPSTLTALQHTYDADAPRPPDGPDIVKLAPGDLDRLPPGALDRLPPPGALDKAPRVRSYGTLDGSSGIDGTIPSGTPSPSSSATGSPPATGTPSPSFSDPPTPPRGEDRSAAVSLIVYCPTLTVGPATLPDTALPGTGDAAGTGWVPGRPIDFTVDGRALVTVTAGKSGEFRGSLRLPRLGCGEHLIEARQVVAQRAAEPLPQPSPLVLSRTGTITVTCTKASLLVDPTVTPAGMVTAATGTGFVAGRQVRLEWVGPDGRLLGEAATATVGSAGTFVATCLVLPNSDLGTRSLRAVEVQPATDPVAARTGTADVLVVPSTMERGRERFLQRG